MLRHLLLAIALVLTTNLLVFSQTGSGTLKGRITDKKTNEPIPFANIVIEKTPEVIFALDRNASWKIYVTNTGSGTAYNVTVVDSMESGLNLSLREKLI